LEGGAAGGGEGQFHCGELFARVGFIVTNLGTSSRAVVRFYNKRGTAEQRIKEGKQAIAIGKTAFSGVRGPEPSNRPFRRCCKDRGQESAWNLAAGGRSV
jgi:hypothetical protein